VQRCHRVLRSSSSMGENALSGMRFLSMPTPDAGAQAQPEIQASVVIEP
jgi:hypothetical protein